MGGGEESLDTPDVKTGRRRKKKGEEEEAEGGGGRFLAAGINSPVY